MGPPLQIPSRRQSQATPNSKTKQPQTFADVTQVPADSLVDIPKQDTPAVYHTVKAGDTLTQIAREHNVSLQELISQNGLDPKAILQIGQMIYIPERP